MAAKRKKTAKKTMKKKAARENLCVGSKVKGYIKSSGMKCAGDLVEALSDQLHATLDAAMARCAGNKRSTVRPVDL